MMPQNGPQEPLIPLHVTAQELVAINAAIAHFLLYLESRPTPRVESVDPVTFRHVRQRRQEQATMIALLASAQRRLIEQTTTPPIPQGRCHE